MISIDTNILFAALDEDNEHHSKAVTFIDSLQDRSDVAISEFMLLELYFLLRNPAVLTKPLSASAAVNVCEVLRQHPNWQVIGFPPDRRSFHGQFWPRLRVKDFARHRAFDWRAGLSLIQQGVTEFATVNLKDSKALGLRGFGILWQ